jgi:hypothetical protein
VEKVRENLRIAQSRQKSYADKRRRELTFAVGDRVYLKVSPLRGTKRFLVKGKLDPRYVGPYQITKRIGSLAYQLALPETMTGVRTEFPRTERESLHLSGSHRKATMCNPCLSNTKIHTNMK